MVRGCVLCRLGAGGLLGVGNRLGRRGEMVGAARRVDRVMT